MNKKYRLILSAAVGVAVVFFIISFNILNFKKDKNFDSLIDELDKNLAAGYRHQACDILNSSFDSIHNSKSALRYLKRLDNYSSLTGDYDLYEEKSDRLSSRYKNNLEIAAVNAYAHYRNRNYNESFRISEKKLSRSEYSSIYLVSALQKGVAVSEISLPEKNGSDFIRLISSSGDQKELSELSKIFGDERLVVDSALLLLREGKVQEAWNDLTASDIDDYNMLRMYVSYDAGYYGKAEEFFLTEVGDFQQPDPGEFLFGCDIMIKSGKYNVAADLYKNLIVHDPDYSWIPYRNLYSLEKNYKSGIEYLYEGIKIFPDNNELKMSAAWEFYLDNDIAGLNDTLSALKDQNAIIDLFRLNLESGSRSPEYVTGNFWTIYNRLPDSETVAGAFAGYLLKNRLFDQFDLLMKRYIDNIGETVDACNYLAAAAAMRGAYEKALTYLDIADTVRETGMTAYNRAVILNTFEDYDNALRYLRFSENQDDFFPENSLNMGKIYLKTAEILYNKGDYKEAYNYILEAENIMPDNIKSSLLLRKIKEENNDQTEK